MNENKLAHFLECGFVICYQHCKTCTFLNNHILHSQGQIQKEMEMKILFTVPVSYTRRETIQTLLNCTTVAL